MARFSLVLGSEGSCVSSELYIQKDELAKHTPILIASYGFVWPSSLRVPQPGLPNNKANKSLKEMFFHCLL